VVVVVGSKYAFTIEEFEARLHAYICLMGVHVKSINRIQKLMILRNGSSTNHNGIIDTGISESDID